MLRRLARWLPFLGVAAFIAAATAGDQVGRQVRERAAGVGDRPGATTVPGAMSSVASTTTTTRAEIAGSFGPRPAGPTADRTTIPVPTSVPAAEATPPVTAGGGGPSALVALAADATGPADVVLTDPAGADVAVGASFRVGLTFSQHTLDVGGDRSARERGGAVATAVARFGNQHLMGFGVLNPEPAPGREDWASLDARMALVDQLGLTPVLTLCCAPDWMKGGADGETDWSRLEVAPDPQHVDDFAALAAAAVRRYPAVRTVLVWNELKGFYDADANRWDVDGYLRLYNAVYDAVKAVDPTIAVGGPYVVMDSWSGADVASHPSDVGGPWGVLDQRSLDVLEAFFAGAHGYDIVVIDGAATPRDGATPAGGTDPYVALDKFTAVDRWIAERTDRPIWWAEWYPLPDGAQRWTAAERAALVARGLVGMVADGVATVLAWAPEDTGEASTGAVWTDTSRAGGGRPADLAAVLAAFRALDGGPVAALASSDPAVAAVAGAEGTVVVNSGRDRRRVGVGGRVVDVPGSGVVFVPAPR